jgi:hypothetical protein
MKSIMAEQLNLDKFKATGVYTVEIDASQTLTFPISSGRLLIGSSRRGPINAAVLIKDPLTSKSVYGGRDALLENKGSYFHKSLEIMLREGPIYALNLMPIDLTNDDGLNLNPDRASFTTFNTESASVNGNSLFPELGTDPLFPKSAPLKDYYNRQKFWFASDIELNKTKNKQLGETISNIGTLPQANKILSFANLSKRMVTVFVQKSALTGFDVTVEEWYKNLGNDVQIPSFLHKDDFISDYLVDTIVVEGDWTNYQKLSTDPIYSRYFTTKGLIRSKINDFLLLKNVTLVTRTSGSLIPDFQDTIGNTISLERTFNNAYPITEMIAAIDTDKLDLMDLEKTAFVNSDISTQRVDIVGHGFDELTETADEGTNYMIDILSYRSPVTNKFKYSKETGTTATDSILFETAGSPALTYIKAYEDSKLYKLWKTGHLVSGDKSIDASGSLTPAPDVYIKISGSFDDVTLVPSSTTKYIIIRGYSDSTLLNESGITTWVVGPNTLLTFQTLQTDYTKEFSLSIFDSWELLNPTKLKVETTTLSPTVLADFFTYVKPGSLLKAKTTEGRVRVLRILSVAKLVDPNSPASTFYTITTMSPQSTTMIGINIGVDGSESIVSYKGIDKFVTELTGLKLTPFKLREQLLPNGTSIRQNEILKYLVDTNIQVAISQGEPLEVRHIVDSYEGDISAASKQYLIELGATHSKTLVFANGPSIKQFEKSTDPSFINSVTGLVSAQYISEGGDLLLNPSFQFDFADGSIKGVPIQSFAHYTIPNLIIREGGKNKSMIPAPYVSNAYIRKFAAGNQYSITAGKRGVITEPDVIGVEYDFTDDDRTFLEPKGFNLLVRRRGIGTMLFTNNTAYQKVNSALNNAHVRDNLITIEKDIERILFNFLFDYNDAVTQIRVRTLVENYLDGVQSGRGISWYEVTIDETNNTGEVISANTAIIDIKVDFARGIHKFINRITITRTGGTLSAVQSGFSAV